MNVIEIKGVTKRYKGSVVFSDISLSIPEKEIFGIIGVNGSGKTTLLKIIIGFLKPDSGDVLYQGKSIFRQQHKIRKEFGFTTQDNSFYPKLTVEENLRYFGALYGLTRKEIKQSINHILPLVELEEQRDKLAEHLSGGMERRLDMACSLIHHPKVLILDEPTEDLDPMLRHQIFDLIKRIKEMGTTVIITTHLLEEVEHLTDRIAILHNRRVLKVGTIDQLQGMFSQKEELQLETISGNYTGLIRALSLKDYSVTGRKLSVATNNAELLLHSIFEFLSKNDDRLIYADVKKPSLSEVFAELTKR